MSSFLNPLIIFLAKDLIFLVLAMAIWFFFKLPKIERKKFFILSIITLPAVYVTAKISSFFYYDPRPFIASHFVPLISHAADNGFPSDHTLILGTVAALLYCFRKKIGGWFFVFAVIVGGARVLAGVHHPIDILGSLVISITVTYLLWRFVIPRLSEKRIC